MTSDMDPRFLSLTGSTSNRGAVFPEASAQGERRSSGCADSQTALAGRRLAGRTALSSVAWSTLLEHLDDLDPFSLSG